MRGDPTGLLDRDVEAQRLSLAVGGDVLRGGDLAVDDDLDRDFASLADSTAFDVPVRLRVEAAAADRLGLLVRFLGKHGVDVEKDLHVAGLGERKLTQFRVWPFFADEDGIARRLRLPKIHRR